MKKAEEQNLWREVESWRWCEAVSDERLGKEKAESYSKHELEVLKDFVIKKRLALQEKLEGYLKFRSYSPFYNSGEICFLEGMELEYFCSHIVGLGEMVYMLMWKHLELVYELQKDYHPFFENAFVYAIKEKG